MSRHYARPHSTVPFRIVRPSRITVDMDEIGHLSRVTDKVADGPGRQINLSEPKKKSDWPNFGSCPTSQASCLWRKFVQPVTDHTPGRTIHCTTVTPKAPKAPYLVTY